jgi:hypothetical protein
MMARRLPEAGGVKWAAAIVVFASLLLLSGCATKPALEPPDGFAEYTGGEAARAVSPEGVTLSVRWVENEPEQSLSFWRNALRTHLERSGYGLLSEDEFEATAGPGVRFEWVAPVGAEDWIYMTAVVNAGARLAVGEAAGPAELYRSHREAIAQSLETIGRD